MSWLTEPTVVASIISGSVLLFCGVMAAAVKRSLKRDDIAVMSLNARLDGGWKSLDDARRAMMDELREEMRLAKKSCDEMIASLKDENIICSRRIADLEGRVRALSGRVNDIVSGAPK